MLVFTESGAGAEEGLGGHCGVRWCERDAESRNQRSNTLTLLSASLVSHRVIPYPLLIHSDAGAHVAETTAKRLSLGH
jgi:hypothetical protein